MNEHQAGKVVELNTEEAKQVTGGSTAVEYGLIAATIAIVIVDAVGAVGQKLGKTFNSVQNKLK